MPKEFPWPIEAMKQWYQSGMTVEEIGRLLSGSGWSEYWEKALGKGYAPTGKAVNKVLKREGCPMRPRGAPGSRNGSYKGGRVVDRDGYVLILAPEHPNATKAGYVREHRLVAEQMLGRHLRPEEVVHHKNHDKSDNRPDNLEVYASQQEHVSAGHRHGDSSRIHIALQTRRAILDERKQKLGALFHTLSVVHGVPSWAIADIAKVDRGTMRRACRLYLGVSNRKRTCPPITHEIQQLIEKLAGILLESANGARWCKPTHCHQKNEHGTASPAL